MEPPAAADDSQYNDNVFESYINKFQPQLDTLAQDKLRLEAESGNMQGLVRT